MADESFKAASSDRLRGDIIITHRGVASMLAMTTLRWAARTRRSI